MNLCYHCKKKVIDLVCIETDLLEAGRCILILDAKGNLLAVTPFIITGKELLRAPPS